MVDPNVTPPAGSPEGEVTPLAEPAVTPPVVTPPAEPAVTPPPEKYDLKVPEKSFLTEAHVEEIAAYSKEQGFSQEKAQALLDKENTLVSSVYAHNAKGGEGWKKQVAAWEKESLADPELANGDKAVLAENAALGQRVLQKFGDQELVDQLLEGAGFGSHPAVLRFMTRIGKAMGEDALILPGASPAGKTPIEDVLYGTPPKT